MNQIKKEVTSTNSQVQSRKPSSLQDYINSDEEYAIVQSVEGSKQIAKIENKEEIINTVVKWRMYIGIPKTDVSEELLLVASFIADNYGFLTLAEIELAIKLSVLRKIEGDFYGYFSPMYVAKVLDSYLHYRKITMTDAIRRKEKADMEEKEKANRPSPENQAENTRKIFRDYYSVWKETGEIRDVFSICYNFLRKHKMLEVSQTMIKEAQEYGKKKVMEAKQKKPLTDRIDMNYFDAEEKSWARTYCVQKYFESVDIDVLANNIKPELFD
jgi:hypothetical protein